MKNLTFLLLLLFANTTLFAQETYKMQVGDQLVYRVEAGDSEYDFIVTPTKLSKNVISFKYEMGEPANINGSITMNADVLKNSIAMYNRFSGGDVSLKNEVSVFASNAMMISAKEGSGPFKTNGMNGDAEDFFVLEGNTSPTNNSTYLKIIKDINGKEYVLDGPIMENENGSKAIRFTDGGGYPFVTYMLLDFKIYLMKIVRNK